MFDMLDDDLDLGYIPTVANTNSRSGSMKKLTKKQSKAAPKQPTTKPNNTKSNEFDDFFDDVLEKESKFLTGTNDVKQTPNNQKAKKDSVDFYFDDPKPTSLQKNKLKITQQPPTISQPKKSNLKLEASDQIISQDFGFTNSFGKPQIQKKEERIEQPSFVSSRNMKPPLKKKDSQSNIGASNLNISLPEQQPKLVLSTQKNDDQIIRPPPRLMNRKPSQDRIQELSVNNVKSQSLTLLPQDKKQNKKEESLKNISKGLSLTFDEPKFQKKQEHKSQFSFSKELKNQPQRPIQRSSFKSFQVQSRPSEKIKEQEKRTPFLKGLDLNVDQSVTWKQSPAPSQMTQKVIAQDYQKQIQHIKTTFQKQVDFLQQNLEKQIALNRETRQKIINESNKMIDDERARSKRLHDQQIKRLKDMYEWEINKMQQNYKNQIMQLKQSLQAVNRSNQTNNYRFNVNSRQEISYLELQLKTQKKILQDRQKILEKREIDLQEREMEISKRKKKQENRLRQEEKRIVQLQARYKKQYMQDKKILQQQKQHIAVQLANLQLQIMKKKETADLSLRDNKQTKQLVQNQRAQLRLANAEIMSKYRAKLQQLQQQRERVRNIQQQLIKKLRVVENKNRELVMNKTMCQKKENNWMQDKNKSFQGRAQSVQKQSLNEKSVMNIKDTRNRYQHLESNTKQKIAIAVRQNNKGFNLDQYMMTVDQYNKMRANVF